MGYAYPFMQLFRQMELADLSARVRRTLSAAAQIPVGLWIALSIRVACGSDEEARLHTVLDRLRDDRIARRQEGLQGDLGAGLGRAQAVGQGAGGEPRARRRLRRARGRDTRRGHRGRPPALGAHLPLRLWRVAGEAQEAPGRAARRRLSQQLWRCGAL